MTTNCLIGTARGSLEPELDGFWLKSVRDKDKRLCIYWDLKEQMSLTLESDEPLKHSYKSRGWLCRTFLTSNLPSCWEALEMVKHNRLCKTCQHSMGERCLQPLHVPNTSSLSSCWQRHPTHSSVPDSSSSQSLEGKGNWQSSCPQMLRFYLQHIHQ